MRLHQRFVRLPRVFDAARLAEEIAQFDDADWRPHLPLVSVGGDPRNDALKGPMRPTPYLARCPYLQEVLASLRSPVGRTRLMRIDGHSESTPVVDSTYYMVYRARVHVPVMAVTASSDDASIHMQPGEAWVLDPSLAHSIRNPAPAPAMQLVVDVVPSSELWATETDPPGALQFETRNFPVVMSPAEQEGLVDFLGSVPAVVRWFLHDWRQLWHRYGESPDGWTEYRALLQRFDAALDSEIVRELLVVPALNPELHPRAPAVIVQRHIERPVFIVSPPRAGSTLLFQTLWRSPTVFATGGESHELIEGIPELHPAQHGWESNRLTAEDVTPDIAAELERRFLAELQARDGSRTLPPRVRLLEKTTKNLLRIPFLRALYPDAFFICLYRDPRATISSLLDAWRTQKLVLYPELPGWRGPGWTLTLVPGWRALIGKPLEEIVAHQWSEGMRIMLDDLEALDRGSWCVASYEALVAEPQPEIERLCRLAGLAWDRHLTAPLPLSISVLTEPSPEKWRRNADAIDRVADRFEAVAIRARQVLTGSGLDTK